MRTLTLLFKTLVVAVTFASAVVAQAADSRIKLGLQCWTFRNYTFEETLGKANALGIRAVQAYSGQALGGGLDGTFGPSMTKAQIATVRKWLKARDVSVVSIGVTGASDEKGWEALADFATEFDIETITTEAEAKDFPMIKRVAKAHGLRIGLHNHPTPSRYADPAFALATVTAASSTFGLCADTGHWTRSGYDPIASLHAAAGHIVELHLKDISEPAPKAHDMPWGTGIGQASRQIAELRRQNFKGYAFIEYEDANAQLEANIGLCIAYFRFALTAPLDVLERGALVPPGYASSPEALWRSKDIASPAMWPSPKPVFEKDLSNADFKPGTWAWDGDVLVAKGGGDLWTKESYGDFSLSLEFRCEKGSNSGVFLRTSDIDNWLHNAIEVQILQGDEENPRHVVGALFDVQAPTRQLPIEPDTWHRYVIIAQGSTIQVILDGETVVKADLDTWTTAGQNPDGSPNKFQKAYRDMARSGRIGLQYHGAPISFRNLNVERL